MERSDRIKALQAALDNVNAAIPILQQGVDNGDTRPSELMEAKNRRDDLAALIADMPDDGALTELGGDDLAELGLLERILDAAIRDNALINATLEGAVQALATANRVHDIFA
jgi:muramoyltetrapeptide carboxypeptidase LdcA involved in peptidoglycan recycling